MTSTRDTIPTPPGDTLAVMRELRAALERQGELCGKLITHLSMAELAILAQEHRTNLLEGRVTDLEGLRARVETLEQKAG